MRFAPPGTPSADDTSHRRGRARRPEIRCSGLQRGPTRTRARRASPGLRPSAARTCTPVHPGACAARTHIFRNSSWIFLTSRGSMPSVSMKGFKGCAARGSARRGHERGELNSPRGAGGAGSRACLHALLERLVLRKGRRCKKGARVSAGGGGAGLRPSLRRTAAQHRTTHLRARSATHWPPRCASRVPRAHWRWLRKSVQSDRSVASASESRESARGGVGRARVPRLSCRLSGPARCARATCMRFSTSRPYAAPRVARFPARVTDLYCWAGLGVLSTPPRGEAPVRRAHALLAARTL